MKYKDETVSYLESSPGRWLLEVLEEAKNPLGFSEIYMKYGSRGSATLTAFIRKGVKLGIINKMETSDPKSKETRILYNITSHGRSILEKCGYK